MQLAIVRYRLMKRTVSILKANAVWMFTCFFFAQRKAFLHLAVGDHASYTLCFSIFRIDLASNL